MVESENAGKNCFVIGEPEIRSEILRLLLTTITC